MSLYDEVWREAMADYRAADLDLDERADRGEYAACGVEYDEYEGEWLERQETRETTA